MPTPKNILRLISGIVRRVLAGSVLLTGGVGALGSPPESPTNTPAASTPGGRVRLSPEQKDWIKAHPVVAVGSNVDFAPYSMRAPGGEFTGLDVDFLDLIGQRTGLVFEHHPFTDVKSALADLAAGRLDMLHVLLRTSEREKFVLFSKPYLEAYSVIVSRVDSPYFLSLRDLRGKRVSLLRGSADREKILAAAPTCEIVEYPTTREQFLALAKSEVDATFSGVSSAAYYIEQMQLSNLRLGSVVGLPSDVHFGVGRDKPLLASIVDAGLDSITVEERQGLFEKWIHVEQAPSRWLALAKTLAVVAAGFALFGFGMLVVSRRLAQSLRERVRIQEELERAHAATSRVSEEKSELMRSIAHDLRSPLTGFKLSTELMAGMIEPGNHEAHANLALMRQVNQRMIALVDELVATHALEDESLLHKVEPVDFGQIVHDSVGPMQAIAGQKNITIRFNPPVPPVRIAASPVALRHMIDNLLSNAVKYSPAGNDVTIGLTADDQGCLLRVVDRGSGVKPSEREMIFQKYGRGSAKPTGGEKSTGLGLWIVLRAAQALHGRAWCEPGPEGIGSAFCVQLPFAKT